MTREEAIKTLKGDAWLSCSEKWNEAFNMAISALSENKGEWVLKQRGKCVDIVCSKCGYVRVKDYAYNFTVEELEKELNEDITNPNYCECCGADMRGE